MLKRVVAVAAVAAISASTMLAMSEPAGASPPFQQLAKSPARMSQFITGGITIKVPSSVTVYNKSRARVSPKVGVRSGVHKAVVRKTITAYSGRHRVASGSAVRLKIGSYTESVKVRYRSFKYVTKTKMITVRTLHDEDVPPNTLCIIKAVSSTFGDGVNDEIDEATCTNSTRPGEPVNSSGADLYDLAQNDDSTVYSIGEQVVSNVVDFPAYYTSRQVAKPYQVKTWTGFHTSTTRKHRLVIKDGGYQRIYSGNQSGKTPYFTVPRHWIGAYAYNCSGFGTSGNWILDIHKKGTPSYEDQTLKNVIGYSGSHAWRFTGEGTFRFEAITECEWAILVRWR